MKIMNEILYVYLFFLSLCVYMCVYVCVYVHVSVYVCVCVCAYMGWSVEGRGRKILLVDHCWCVCLCIFMFKNVKFYFTAQTFPLFM